MFRYLFQALIILWPLLTLLIWIFAHQIPLDWLRDPHATYQVTLTSEVQFLGFLVDCIPLTFVIYCLYQLIRLFKNYEVKQIFTLENAKRYRKLGLGTFAWVIANILSKSLTSLVLTMYNPSGKHVLIAYFGSNDIPPLILSGLVILISWIMMEGYRIADDHAKTI
jgi:hypothetical protein